MNRTIINLTCLAALAAGVANWGSTPAERPGPLVFTQSMRDVCYQTARSYRATAVQWRQKYQDHAMQVPNTRRSLQLVLDSRRQATFEIRARQFPWALDNDLVRIKTT